MADEITHKFERAGLGKAPYKMVAFERRTYQACPGAPEGTQQQRRLAHPGGPGPEVGRLAMSAGGPLDKDRLRQKAYFARRQEDAELDHAARDCDACVREGIEQAAYTSK